MSPSDFQEWADRFLLFPAAPRKDGAWLDTMKKLCAALGHPEKSSSAVHVAGSKGKGSVSMMISRILGAAGFRTGLYLSPHVSDFTERVSSGGLPFSGDVYARAASEVCSAVDAYDGERTLTWFEAITLFAFASFRAAAVDWGVFETGLGGTLDATNVLFPRLSVITAIELEHTEFLGDTVEKIAGEKAGIIKEGVPVVASSQSAPVREVFRRAAFDRGAPLTFVDDKVTISENEVTIGGQRVVLCSDLFRRPLRVTMGMIGECQGHNAALAALAVKTLDPGMDEGLIEEGLAAARLPARFQVVRPVPSFPRMRALVIDGAHTRNSAAQGVAAFSALFSGGASLHGEGGASLHGEGGGDAETPWYLLFACGKTKNAAAMAPLFRRFTAVTLTRPGEFPGLEEEALSGAFRNAGIAHSYNDDYTGAIKGALEEANRRGAALFVTGSFYLSGEVFKVLRALQPVGDDFDKKKGNDG